MKPDGDPGLDRGRKVSPDTLRGESSGDGRFMLFTGPRPGETGGGPTGDRGAIMPSEVSRRRERGRRRGSDSRGSMSYSALNREVRPCVATGLLGEGGWSPEPME